MDGTKIAVKRIRKYVRLFGMAVRNSPAAWAMSLFSFFFFCSLMGGALNKKGLRHFFALNSSSFPAVLLTRQENTKPNSRLQLFMSCFLLLSARTTFYFVEANKSFGTVALRVCNLFSSGSSANWNVQSGAVGSLLLLLLAAGGKAIKCLVGAHLSCWSFISTDPSSTAPIAT